jgi:exonuclease SbcC
MRIESVALHNFRQHTETSLSFGDGLTGIIGANGSGKSTILEAIAWALYGNAAARGNKDSIPNLRAGKGAHVRVELEFTLGGQRYRIERTLKGADVYLNGGAEPVARTIRATNELLQRTLGMSKQEFFQTYFTGQKELDVMSGLGPAERARFLSRVLGYDRIAMAQKEVREQRKALVAEIRGARGTLPDPEVVVERIRVANDHAQHAVTQHERAVVAWQQASAQLATVTPAWEQMAAVREAFLARDAQRRTLTGQCTLLQEQRAALEARLVELESAPEYAAREQVALAAARTALQSADDALTASRDLWMRDRQEAMTRVEALQLQESELTQQYDSLQGLGSESPCPTCGKPIGSGYDAMVKTVAEQLDTLRTDVSYFRTRVKQLAAAPTAVREQEAKRTAAQQEVQHHEARANKIDAALKERDQKRLDRDTVTSRLALLDAQLTALDASASVPAAMRSAESDSSTTPAEQVLPLAYSEAEYTRLRAAHEQATRAARDAERVATAADTDRRVAEQELAHARREQQRIAEVEQQVASLEVERAMHDELDDELSLLRDELNEQLRPELSEIASQFLESLTDGRYSALEITDEYELQVLEDGLPKTVLSGGEEDLCNLVLRLAISQMIAERAGQQFSLLVLDEVFGSLDASRRENVLALLRRLHDQFEQVVVISHIDDVREGLDRIMAVTYDAERGTSRVQVVDPLLDPALDGWREGGSSLRDMTAVVPVVAL